MATAMLPLMLACYVLPSVARAKQDTNANCKEWAQRGECKSNPSYMLANCAASCERVNRQEKRNSPKPQSEGEQQQAALRMVACSGSAASTEDTEKKITACQEQCGTDAEDCRQLCSDLMPKELHGFLEPCAPWPHISGVSLSKGFHVMCLVRTDPSARAGNSACEGVLGNMIVFRDGRTSSRPEVHAIPSNISTVAAFVAHTEDVLGKNVLWLHRFAAQSGGDMDLFQSGAAFTPQGERLLDLHSLLGLPLVFFFEGGQWVWPTVRLNHTVQLPGLRSPEEVTTIRTVSITPAVFEVDHFLKSEESAHIISQVEHRIKKSPVAMKDDDAAKGKGAADFRTSSQEFLTTRGDAMLEAVDARVQALTKIPITHAEHIQVLRYNHKEHYSAHHDFFDPSAYKSNAQMLDMVQMGAVNRMATVFFYLTNVTRGGETNFPRAGGLPQPRDFFDCSKGYSSYPKANKVIIFYSMLPNGQMDDNSLHSGCDVLEGQKWSANFWLWNKPQEYNSRHKRRRQMAEQVGAIGDPFNREVKYLETPASNMEL